MKKAILIFCIVFAVCQLALALPLQEEKRKPKRVKRPTIDKKNSTYFQNVFKDALVGDRPAPATKEQLAKKNQTTTTSSGGGGASTGTPAGAGWGKVISEELILAELKTLSNALNQNVTSPGKFKSGGNRDVRQTCSMIAVLFGVIAEFDGEVKWKDISAGARDAFAQCAQSASTTSNQAYNQAKNRKEDLQQILSGGPFTPPVKPSEDFEWASVADVSELMKRLKSSYREKVKPWVASEKDYKDNLDNLMQEAAMMAVIGEVLKKESMENADNDDYAEFCDSLRDGALMIINSKTSKDLDMAVKGAGMIDQSCQNCHGEYN